MMFKDGDMVMPTARARSQFRGNNFGTGVGVITTGDDEHWGYKYRVDWEDGRAAWYNDEHLVLVPVDLENK